MNKLSWAMVVVLVAGAWVIWEERTAEELRREVSDREAGREVGRMDEHGKDAEGIREAADKITRWFSTDADVRQMEKEGPPVQPGEVRVEGSGDGMRQVLMDEGREVMRARRIGGRTKSLGGMYVVETWNGPHLPPGEAERVEVDGVWRFDSTPREIWLVANGEMRCVSPRGVDATMPVISPDAGKVAYTARRYDGRDWGGETLVCLEVGTGKEATLLEAGRRDSYLVSAIDWRGSAGELRALEIWGETGSHFKFRKFRIP